MESNTIVDNIKENNILLYNSILQKIRHKPLIVSNIFSYVKDQPYKFMALIEKDITLKNSINSLFFNTKINNKLSEELNENIRLIKTYSKIRSIITEYKNKEINISNTNSFEFYAIKNKLDPSFSKYKTHYYLKLLEDDDINKNIKLKNYSISCITDIVFNVQKNQKNIQLVYLPYNETEYKDSEFFYNNKNNIKEIDELYCIIDDNEYYKQKNLIKINKNIIINDVYFIYIKGNKNINIFNAIKEYLIILKENTFKQISLGCNLFVVDWNDKEKNNDYKLYDKIPIVQMVNYALINNKALTNLIPEKLPIKLKWFSFNSLGTKLKVILGLFLIFEKQAIDGFVVLNSNIFLNNEQDKTYKNIEDMAKITGNALIIKFKDFNNIVLPKIKSLLKKIQIKDVVFYECKNENKNLEINQNKLDLKDINDKNFIFYSENPNDKRKFTYDHHYLYLEVTDNNNNLILSLKSGFYISDRSKWLYNLLFLLDKYNKICFNYLIYNNYYKIDFIKQKHIAYFYGVNNAIADNAIIDINEINDYIKSNFSLNFDNIIKNNFNNDKNIYRDKNKSKKNGNKGFSYKMNPKQMIENELDEEDIYYDEDDDDDEEENEYDDSNED